MEPGAVDWERMGSAEAPFSWREDSAWQDLEMKERQEDLVELEWLLTQIDNRLAFYKADYPDHQFEGALAAAFGQEAGRLRERVAAYKRDPGPCTFNAYLGLKYEIRTLYKQVGAMLNGSDWQTPAADAKDGHSAQREQAQQAEPARPVPVEQGFTQREQGTYMRSYGSEYVKSYEEDVLNAFYPMSAACRAQCVRFVTTSGMSALELALAVYKKATSEQLPCYIQQGFYGEGVELANVLLRGPQVAHAEQILTLVEQGAPIGCVMVDPGVCWPVEPPIDLDRLMNGLERHRQEDPLYVIVDRTLTGIANPVFERYGDRLPPHVVLVCAESGIKYQEYGLDLANFGFLAAVGNGVKQQEDSWITMLGLLTAGADPVMVRQLPIPDMTRLKARLSRLNRNASLADSLLRHLTGRGHIEGYDPSVRPSEQYQLEGRPWMGSVFYIRFRKGLQVADYQTWIDRLVDQAPEELHLTAGGSFGFDSFRFNTVTDGMGERNALRMSVGRDPIGQLLDKLRVLYSAWTP